MSQRIRVLHILTTLDVGGAENKVLSVASRLPRERYEVSAAWLKGRGELAPEFERRGIDTTFLKIRGLTDAGLMRRALRLIHRIRPHIVHTHLMKADFVGSIAARLSSVPVVVSTKHNEDQYLRFLPYALGGRVAADLADRVVVISSAVGRFFEKRLRLGDEKVTRIPYGFPENGAAASDEDRADLRRELGLAPDTPLVTTVGRLTKQKGLTDLLRAASLIRESVPAFKLLLVGRGELHSALRETAKTLELLDTVRFLGFRRDIARILAGSDLFVLPSHWEGFGVVLIEAMYAGLAIVGTRAGAIPEVVAEGETGLLAPVGDPESLATAIIRLLADRPLAEKMGRAGRARAAREFAIDREVRAHTDLYESLLTARRAR